MDPIIVAAAFGFLGVCVVALVPFLQYRQGKANEERATRETERREQDSERQRQIADAVAHAARVSAEASTAAATAAKAAATATDGVSQQVISLAGTVDGNLTRMVEQAEALGQARAEVEALRAAAELALQTAAALEEARRAPSNITPEVPLTRQIDETVTRTVEEKAPKEETT